MRYIPGQRKPTQGDNQVARMYNNPSNARRAAAAFAAKHPDTFIVAASIRSPGITSMYFPTLALVKDAVLDDKLKAAVEDTVKLVDASEVEPDVEEAPAPKPARKAKAPAKAKPKAKQPKAKPKAKGGNKTARAMDLMSRKDGATAAELIKEFGWEPHTLRGFVSIKNNASRTDPVWNIKTVKGTEGKPTRYVIG